jgi:hypothetical protein
MKLLNRKDFTGTLRFLDREVILTRAVVSLVDLFMRHPPALVVFQVTPHEFLPYLAQWVARYLGHQTLYFEPSPISPTQIPHSDRGRLLVPSRALVSGSRVESAVRAIARERLGVLRGGQVPQYLEIQKNRDYTVRKLPERVKAVRFYFRKPRSRVVTDGIEATTSRGMLRAVGMGDDDWDKPQIGIASSWNEITPCNLSLGRLAQAAKEACPRGGGYPLQFGTVSVSDGISMGHEGMHFSLVSREVIADSVETVMQAERLDGSVLLAGCDKSIPGMLMAAARLDLASVFLYAARLPRAG